MRLMNGGPDVLFEIEDRGQGISDQDLPRVFMPFFRGEPSRSRDTGGVGLGLTLAKRIVEAHAGTIELRSRFDVGTVVRVKLPCHGECQVSGTPVRLASQRRS
jgi:signal transduction histidine kinase